MAYTEAQKKASMKYLSEKTDDIRLRVPRGTKERFKKAAEHYDLSMTQFVLAAVEEKIERDGIVLNDAGVLKTKEATENIE